MKPIKAFLLLFFVSVLAQAQDTQYSQFYSAPLYLNPAFTGATQLTRVGTNYRNQWPALTANYTTMSAYVDHFVDDKNLGIGLLINTDREGLAGLRSTLFGGQVSYQLPLTDRLTIRAGGQAAYYLRNVDFSALTFGDQFDPTGFIGPTAETIDPSAVKGFFDLAFGGLLYSENAWIGVAAHHLNRPNTSIVGGGVPLDRKWSYHAGYKFFLKSGVMGQGLFAKTQERSLAPTVQYKYMGPFSQMDLGLYYTFEPLVFGTWYRGLPFKKFESFTNHESIVFLVGYTQKNKDNRLNIGYSYDFTISNLGASSGGAHEFSISYAWFTGDPRKPPKNVREIPCPNF